MAPAAAVAAPASSSMLSLASVQAPPSPAASIGIAPRSGGLTPSNGLPRSRSASEVTNLPGSPFRRPQVTPLQLGSREGSEAGGGSSMPSAASAAGKGPGQRKGRAASIASSGRLSLAGGIPRTPQQRAPMRDLKAASRACDTKLTGDRTPQQKAMSETALRQNRRFGEAFASVITDDSDVADNNAKQRAAVADRTLSPTGTAAVTRGFDPPGVEALGESINEVEALLRAITKKGQNTGTVDQGPTPEEEARMEAERRRKELLEQHRNERDAKRTVQLKLQVARIEEGSALRVRAPIPTVKISSSASGKNPEEVDIVDVRAVRSRCLQLQNGVSVKSLMDLKLEHEAHERRLKQGMLPVPSCYGSPMRSRCPSIAESEEVAPSFLAPLGPKAQKLRRKMQEVKSTRTARQFDSMLRQLSTMRGAPPENALERFEALAQKVLPGDEDGDMPNRFRHLYEDAATRSIPFLQTSTSLPSESFKLTQQIAMGLGATMVERVMTPPVERAVTRQKDPTDMLLNTKIDTGKKALENRYQQARVAKKGRRAAARMRIKKLWKKLIIFTRALMPILGHFLRYRSAEIVKAFLSQLGEYSRIKSAITRMRKKVLIMQKGMKRALAIKKTHLAHMTAYWKEVEDYHLCQYYREFLQQVVVEKNQGRRPNAVWRHDMVNTLIPQSDDEGSPTTGFNWRRYRIPTDERKAVLARYYTVRRDQSILRERQLAEHLAKAAEERAELSALGMGQVDDEGAEEQPVLSKSSVLERKPPTAAPAPPEPKASASGRAKGSPGPRRHKASANAEKQSPQGAGRGVVRRFWHLTEDTVLDMIYLVASSLSSVDPFMQHPANMEAGPHNPMNRKQQQGTGSREYLMKNKAKQQQGTVEKVKTPLLRKVSVDSDLGEEDDPVMRLLEAPQFRKPEDSPGATPGGSGKTTPGIQTPAEYQPIY